MKGKTTKASPTEETDYMVTATCARAGKPDTDLEIDSTNFDGPQSARAQGSSMKVRMEAWAKIGLGRTMEIDR